jgi:hypothetical protein
MTNEIGTFGEGGGNIKPTTMPSTSQMAVNGGLCDFHTNSSSIVNYPARYFLYSVPVIKQYCPLSFRYLKLLWRIREAESDPELKSDILAKLRLFWSPKQNSKLDFFFQKEPTSEMLILRNYNGSRRH